MWPWKKKKEEEIRYHGKPLRECTKDELGRLVTDVNFAYAHGRYREFAPRRNRVLHAVAEELFRRIQEGR